MVRFLSFIRDSCYILNWSRTGSYPVEGLPQHCIPWISPWLTDCTLECGNQLIMALSYTQKTSDNSLITKYVRKTPNSTSWLKLTRRARTAIVVRSIRHLPCPERFVYCEPVFHRQFQWSTREPDEPRCQGVLFVRCILLVSPAYDVCPIPSKSIVALKAASGIFQILGSNDKSQQYNVRRRTLLYH